MRFSSNPKPWDFDVEADYQFGQSGAGDISAWSIAVDRFADTAFASYGTATITGARFPAGRLNAEFGLPTAEITLPVAAAA